MPPIMHTTSRMTANRKRQGNPNIPVQDGSPTDPSYVPKVVDESEMPLDGEIQLPVNSTPLQLASHLDDLRIWAEPFHDNLAMSRALENAEAVGKFTALIVNIADTTAAIRGGNLDGGDYGSLSDRQVQDLKGVYARTLSRNAMKLKQAADYVKAHGCLDEETGIVERWAAVGFVALLSGAHSVVKRWVKLYQWEMERYPPEEDPRETYRRVIQGQYGNPHGKNVAQIMKEQNG